MRLIFFIGACDKSDLLLPASLILARMKRRVLVVDAMSSPWLTYRNNTWMNRTKWSNWQGIDTVSCIQHWDELNYLAAEAGESLEAYDDIWVDTDRVTFCEGERLINAHARFVIQTLDAGSLHRNLEWLNTFHLLHDTRLEGLLHFVVLQSIAAGPDRAYVEQYMQTAGFMALDTLVIPYDERNWSARISNEYGEYTQLQRYPRVMRDGWRLLAEAAGGPIGDTEWKRAMKMSTKGQGYHEAM